MWGLTSPLQEGSNFYPDTERGKLRGMRAVPMFQYSCFLIALDAFSPGAPGLDARAWRGVFHILSEKPRRS